MGGLTAALALTRAGVEVEVHEKFPHLQGRATGFTIWSYAIRELLDLGVSQDHLDRVGSAIEYTELRNEAGELIELMPVGEVSRKLGAPSYDLARGALQEALVDAIGVDAVRMGSECVGVEQSPDSATALLADGSRATGDVVLAADGIHSVVREAVTGPSQLAYSGFSGSGAVVDFTHELLPERHHIELWSRGSKGGIADIGGGRVRWYLMTHAPAGGAAPSRSAMLDHVRTWYPALRDAIEATPERDIVHTEAWDLDPLPTWVDGRVVLIGDAAHATTPFAAMGACTAIEDAAALARLLTARPVSDALADYEALRKKRGEQVTRHSRRMARVATLHSPILAWLRDEAFEHMPADKVEQVAEEMAAGTG